MTDRECLEQILCSLKFTVRNNKDEYYTSTEEIYNSITYTIGYDPPRIVFHFDSRGNFLEYYVER